MSDICTDNRFSLIEKYKRKLIEATNIEQSTLEMATLDNILFRIWQMGWLDKLEYPEPHWIPCKTRLPEDEGTYIVTDVDGDVEIAWYQEDWRDDKEVMAWFLDEYGWIEVLAWMPLPEPYKEGDNERA